MFSGQEIVSQEECKIVLAEFYEGVSCYKPSATVNGVLEPETIKFLLLDWATATYDAATMTLDTRNFSCRPVIITEIKNTFEAGIPPGTTGLEVHMHTAEYERTRIMPLIYLPECSVWNWEDPEYGDRDWAYVLKFCNEETETVVEVDGEVDTINSTTISFVGAQDTSDTAALTLEFLDGNDDVMNIAPTIVTEDRQMASWVYNEETQVWEQVEITKSILIVTVDLAASIRFSGLYEYTANLYNCLLQIGAVTDFCNVTTPYETRISTVTDTYEELADGWFKLDTDTEFRLLPTHNFLRKESFNYFFSGAEQIEFRVPREATYDIFTCFDDGSYNSFYIYPTFYWDNSTSEWIFELYLYGDYTITQWAVIDNVSGDSYTFFYTDGTPIDLTALTEYITSVYRLDALSGHCGSYYKINNGVSIEIFSGSVPYHEDFRVVWDSTKCKFITNCEAIGYFPCPCVNCEDLPGDETSRVYTTNAPTQTCTDSGNQLTDSSVSGCDGNTFLGLGAYPDLTEIEDTDGAEPAPKTTTVDHVYFKGLSMFIPLKWPLSNNTYIAYIGDLSQGMTIRDVTDDATDSTYSVNLLPYIYLTVFKFPFKYVKSDGLDRNLWHDDEIFSDDWIRFTCDDTFWDIPCYGWEASGCEVNWPPVKFCDEDYGKTEAELLIDGITPGGGLFDFRIELEELISRLPTEWTTGFDWYSSCSWISANIKRFASGLDLTVGVNNITDLDNVTCEEDFRAKYQTSNVPLEYGPGIIPPPAANGIFQEGYDEYVDNVNLLISREAEAYAYYNGIYEEAIPEEEEEEPQA